MITSEQLKEIQNRAAELGRYLDIDKKKIELEEAQLHTQAPDFWEDSKKAEKQMVSLRHQCARQKEKMVELPADAFAFTALTAEK